MWRAPTHPFPSFSPPRTIDSLSGVAGAVPGLGVPGPGAPRNLRITIPKWCGKWAVGMDEFKDGVVGAKSRNLANLRGKLPDWVRLPPAVTVPFGSFEKVRRWRPVAWPGPRRASCLVLPLHPETRGRQPAAAALRLGFWALLATPLHPRAGSGGARECGTQEGAGGDPQDPARAAQAPALSAQRQWQWQRCDRQRQRRRLADQQRRQQRRGQAGRASAAAGALQGAGNAGQGEEQQRDGGRQPWYSPGQAAPQDTARRDCISYSGSFTGCRALRGT
jgi:hypothetical protein